MTDYFLLDSVTLAKMKPAQRAGDFVRNFCRIPAPVLFEVRGLSDINYLKTLEYATTIEVLDQLHRALEGVTTKDKLLDLYRNKGNGDVFLLAVALLETDVLNGKLFGNRWVIATDDRPLTRQAAALEVATCTSTEFIAALPASASAPT